MPGSVVRSVSSGPEASGVFFMELSAGSFSASEPDSGVSLEGEELESEESEDSSSELEDEGIFCASRAFGGGVSAPYTSEEAPWPWASSPSSPSALCELPPSSPWPSPWEWPCPWPSDLGEGQRYQQEGMVTAAAPIALQYYTKLELSTFVSLRV